MDDLTAREAYRRSVEKLERRELLFALPILEIFHHIADALDRTSHNLVGAAEIERERKAGSPQRRPYRFRLTPQRELPEDEEGDARMIEQGAVKALNAISLVMERSLEAALLVLQSADPKQRKYAAEMLVNQLTSTIERLLWQSTAPWSDGIRKIATERTEFPSLISLSRKINNDRERLLLHQLKLGEKLPFCIDPRTTYTPHTRLAMQIVSFIDDDRRRKSSIYGIVVPGFSKKSFVRTNYLAWDKVINFHLDFFQSPDSRRVKFAQQQDTRLRKALERRLSQAAKNHFVRPRHLSPFGELTEMLEFKYRDGKPVRVSYNELKYKVVRAGLALLR